MDSRHAKRYANLHLAQVAEDTAELIEQSYRVGETWAGLDRRDATRVAVALRELHDELNRRGQTQKSLRGQSWTRPTIPVDPNQVALFEETTDGV